MFVVCRNGIDSTCSLALRYESKSVISVCNDRNACLFLSGHEATVDVEIVISGLPYFLIQCTQLGKRRAQYITRWTLDCIATVE